MEVLCSGCFLLRSCKRLRLAAGKNPLLGPGSSWLFALLLFLAVAGAASSVEVHFESKDGGFFLKHSPRQFYPINPHAEFGGPLPGNSGSISGLSSGPVSPGGSAEPSTSNSILSVDKFTVFQTSEPVSIRASYGPFSTKQTVPARYIVPDPLEIIPSQGSSDPSGSKKNGTTSNALLEAQELGSRHLDMSAHVVTSSIPRDSPVLRVLFHAGSEASGRRQLLQGRLQRVCVLLHATLAASPNLPGNTLSATCSPDGQDGVCMAQITIPANWWPPLPPPDSAGRVKPVKTLPRLVQLSYSVLEPKIAEDANGNHRPLEALSSPTSTASSSSSSSASAANSFCQPRVQIQPATPLGQVTLAPNRAAFKELKTDEYLTLLVPHGPLYPRSRLHVPVFLQSHSSKQPNQTRPPVAAVVLRARVKSGVKILDASSSNPDWIVESDIKNKNSATFTARRKENVSRLPNASAEEIMSMLLEASEENSESKEHGGRIVWSVRYALEGEEDNVSLSGAFQLNGNNNQQQQQHHHHAASISDRKKLQAHLEIQKDDIQAVLPISKNWEVMNTAVLTGRQISQAMKVFIISQAGTVADVTLQSSCHSEDESVLKVSSSCSSVYVDGSEIRGSSNASVLVKFGTYTGLAKFTVWMPEFPLEVSVTDPRLNQIKGWKVPEEHPTTAKTKRSLSTSFPPTSVRTESSQFRRNPPIPLEDDVVEYEDVFDEDEDEEEDEEDEEEDLVVGKMRFRSGGKWEEVNSIEKTPTGSNCRLRFQQSPVEVHARFLAADHDSGRVSYFVNRRTWLRVTDLVSGLLRVSDPRIAVLMQGKVVQGRGIGRTEVQVLSPITGRVIGAKEIRVGNDRVSIAQLSVKVVSGLQLTINPEATIENGYVAETSVTRKLTAQYQEGLLDIDIEFSDGSKTPLRDIAVSDYHLLVESLDSEVVAFAPMVASHHPRVIAVGEGRGDLLRITLQLPEVCRSSPRRTVKGPASRLTPSIQLATALANVEVDFASGEMPTRPEFVQNDGGGNFASGHHRERKNGREMASDLHDILNGASGNSGVRHGSGSTMTPLEIGMYILLVAFCFAILVFVASCVVYTSKFKPNNSEMTLGGLPVFGAARAAANQFAQNRRPRESTTNAHDWVWLGRATLERTTCSPQRVRVTSNPLSGEPEDETINLATSFDNPNHLELPSIVRSKPTSAPIDTTTYCKRPSKTFVSNKPTHLNSPSKNSTQINDNENNMPPPLPPHNGTAVSPKKSYPSPYSMNGNEEYKPPVPPHRGSSSVHQGENPKKRHHQRTSSAGDGRRHEQESKNHHHRRAHKPSSSNSQKNSKEKTVPTNDDNSNHSSFIGKELARPSKKAREVKRAMVVDNPMFSSSSSDSSCSSSSGQDQEEQPATLEDLNLGMDYNQIMQYFDNLKESNA